MNFIRRYIYYLIGLAAVIIAIQTYFIWFKPRNDAWQLIPDDALAIVESTQLQQNIFDEKNTNANLIADVPFFFDAKKQLDMIIQTTDNQEFSRKFLLNKQITFSLHAENKQKLEYIIYIPYDTFSDEGFLKNLERPDPSKIHAFGSNFGGYKITEVQTAEKSLLFHYFMHKNHMICSKSLVLVQDVIRKINSNSPSIGQNPFKLSRKGIAHIYFNREQLRNHADVLKEQLNVPNLVTYFTNIMPPNADLVFESSKEPKFLSGYIYSTIRTQKPFVGIFKEQISKGLLAKHLVPQSTAILYHLGFSNTKKLQKSFMDFMRIYERDNQAVKDTLKRTWQVEVNALYPTLKDEIILCEMQSSSAILSSKVLLLKTNEITDALAIMNDFAHKTEILELPNPVEKEAFIHKYRKIIINELPSLLFGSAYNGFSNSCYFSHDGDYLIITNTEDAMIDYLKQNAEGKMWSNQNIEFLQKINPKAQISSIVIPQRIWQNIYRSLDNNSWQASIQKHQFRFKDLRYLCLQTFVNEGEFGTKILIEKTIKTQKSALLNKFFLQDSLVVNNDISTTPYFIFNKNSQTDEIITQSTDNQLFLLNNKAQIIDRDTISQRLHGSMYATDYFQNGLTQYLVNSPNYLYVFKRDMQEGLQAYIPNVPVVGGIRAVAVEGKKIYVADDAGNVFLIDEDKQNVTKLRVRTPFKRVFSIQPFQYKNVDYLAVLQENGMLAVIGENGALINNNFPVLVGGSNTQVAGLYIDKTSNSFMPFISVITSQGEIARYDVVGNKDVTNSTQIQKQESTSTFEVLFDQNHKDYIIVERTLTEVFITEKYLKKRFSLIKTNSKKIQLKYFDLGDDLKFIVAFDGKGNSIFDLNGNQIGGVEKAIPATALPNLSYLDNYNKLFIYNPNGKKFEIWTVKIK
jgi:hypothetical protein